MWQFLHNNHEWTLLLSTITTQCPRVQPVWHSAQSLCAPVPSDSVPQNPASMAQCPVTQCPRMQPVCPSARGPVPSDSVPQCPVTLCPGAPPCRNGGFSTS